MGLFDRLFGIEKAEDPQGAERSEQVPEDHFRRLDVRRGDFGLDKRVVKKFAETHGVFLLL